jgi:hypothetical protein
MKTAHFFLLAAVSALSGCALPIPTTRVVVPSVYGRVLDGSDSQPIDMAGVMVDGHKETAVLTRRDGTFSTHEISRSSLFRIWNPFAQERTEKIKLRVVRPGYAKHKQKIAWQPATQRAVHLSEPIKLERKSGAESVAELLNR